MSEDRFEVRNLSLMVESLTAQVAEMKERLVEIRGLVGPFGVSMPDNQVLVQTLFNIKYLIDARDQIMAPQLIVYRQWEPELSRFVTSAVHKDSVFIDVGANFGYFTCLVGTFIGTGGNGRVIAIEPNPDSLKLLRANVLINWSLCPIEIHPFAAGDLEKKVQLSVPVDRAANASLSTHVPGEKVSRIGVELKPLDAIVRPGTSVDLMKVDVEGHEFSVLHGARRVIEESKNIKIIVEWSEEQMRVAGYTGSTIIDLIANLGLRTYHVPAHAALPPQPYPKDELIGTKYDNILLMR